MSLEYSGAIDAAPTCELAAFCVAQKVGELDYLDDGTLAAAMKSRRPF